MQAVKVVKKYVGRYKEKYNNLENWIPVESKTAKRWVEFLGFEVNMDDPVELSNGFHYARYFWEKS